MDQETNQTLTQTGPGTPMGELMRRYWHPIAAVAQLEDKAVMPVLVTEHQSHTNAQWSTYVSNGDNAFEASRLSSQI